jgi:hypothetical protein
MKSKLNLVTLILIIIALIFSVSAIAMAGMLIPASEKAREKSRADDSPVIEKVNDHFVLTPSGLERIVFIHYKKDFAKLSWAGKGKREKQNYKLLRKGVKWKSLPINYVIDPDNPEGLTQDFVTNAISNGAEEWDAHTSTELFENYTIDYNASWDGNAPDGRNEFVFGNYPEEGVIGVTVVWGYFSGPPSTREIIEFDTLFDTDFTWGDATLNSALMDLQNIATHEIGHGLGLADLYGESRSEETMYGYSEYGETKKRDLNTGDIAGIQVLYGE